MPKLDHVAALQALHDSEIHFGITVMFDGCFDVYLACPMGDWEAWAKANGCHSQLDCMEEAIEGLCRLAIWHHPSSQFAREWADQLAVRGPRAAQRDVPRPGLGLG